MIAMRRINGYDKVTEAEHAALLEAERDREADQASTGIYCGRCASWTCPHARQLADGLRRR